MRQSLFDRWSATYDSPGLQRSTYRPIHDAVLRRLRDVEPTTVVDLGCGTGQLTRRLTERYPGATVIGLDLSAGMLAEATERLGGDDPTPHPLVRADAEHLPFAPSTVDVVVCTESFHWYQHQDRALSELARVLRTNGRLLIASIAMVTAAGDRMVRAMTRGGPNPIRALPPRRLRALLGRAGFEVDHQQRIPRLGLVAWPVLTDARRRSRR